MTVEQKVQTLRLPPWIRIRYGGGGAHETVGRLLESHALNTVCQGAHCPNQHDCFNRGVATFMILGDVCTRDCRFCAVKAGAPVPVDTDEPRRVAEAAARLKLRHVVVTSVTRDDLPDGGARHFAATIRALHELLPGATVEVLTPDFKGIEKDVTTVLESGPDVFNHNLETVRRLQKTIRPAADYDRSLAVLAYAARRGRSPWTMDPGQMMSDAGSRIEAAGSCNPHPVSRILTKSGLMVGLGETDEEVYEAMTDLRAAGVELLTIGQYLAPSAGHAAVQRFVHPSQFEEYARRGMAMGFVNVASAPLVRSSYMAEAQFRRGP